MKILFWVIMRLRICMKIKPENNSNIKVTCPTRIDFTGGFTDVMPFRATQWVSHVNLAIDLPVEVMIEPGNGSCVTLEDSRNSTSVMFSSVDKIDDRFSLIRAALRNFEIGGGITIKIHSHAPHGAGLGTSGALSVALVAALILFTGQTLPDDKSEMAMLAAEIERMSDALGGLQDQFASAMGGLHLFKFRGFEHSSEQVVLSDPLKREIENNVFILYPGGSRRSTDIVTKVMKEYSGGNLAVSSALFSLNKLAGKIMESLKCAEFAKLSSLLHDVREQQLILHPDLADGGNLRILNNLSELGVEGAKLLGGGGCGACLLVASKDHASREAIINFCGVYNVDIIPVRCASKGIEVKINHIMSVV
jgi:D-glycero-alpha-D-manno-heptose-7-phosphate kinase